MCTKPYHRSRPMLIHVVNETEGKKEKLKNKKIIKSKRDKDKFWFMNVASTLSRFYYWIYLRIVGVETLYVNYVVDGIICLEVKIIYILLGCQRICNCS